MAGRFIVIEGLDATGKSTLVPKLTKKLNAALLTCPPQLEDLDSRRGISVWTSIAVLPRRVALTGPPIP